MTRITTTNYGFQRHAIVEEGILREAGERFAAAGPHRERGKDETDLGKVVDCKRGDLEWSASRIPAFVIDRSSV
jgi:hypothetical protein